MTTQTTNSATPQAAAGIDSARGALDSRIDGVPTELLVGGQLRPASDGGTFPVLDPATGKTLADVANGTEADALACVDAADAAAAHWAATPPRSRGEILRTAFELMVDRADQLAALIVAENGKALPDARGEVLYSAEFFRWYSEEAVRIDGQVRTAPAGTNKILVIHQPVGIAVLVTPWNFPAAMASRKIGPALAAGCTVILKPASETPLTALALASILEEAGAPAGRGQCAPIAPVGPGRVGDARRSPRAEAVVHRLHRGRPHAAARRPPNTSSTARWNWAETRRSSSSTTPISTRRSTARMIAKMRNGGEACTAANRFYVEASDCRGVHDQRLTAAMSALKVGPGSDADVAVGPLINDSAAPQGRRVGRPCRRAGRDPAHRRNRAGRRGLLLPADRPVRRDPSMQTILQTEIFGPVAPIVTFTTEDEAIDAGQQHRVRPCFLRLYGGSRPWPSSERANRGRHGWPQSGAGVRPGRTVRRREGERPGPRRRHRRAARLHRKQVRRRGLVGHRGEGTATAWTVLPPMGDGIHASPASRTVIATWTRLVTSSLVGSRETYALTTCWPRSRQPSIIWSSSAPARSSRPARCRDRQLLRRRRSPTCSSSAPSSVSAGGSAPARPTAGC